MEDRNENKGEKQADMRGDFKGTVSSRSEASVIQFLSSTTSIPFSTGTNDHATRLSHKQRCISGYPVKSRKCTVLVQMAQSCIASLEENSPSVLDLMQKEQGKHDWSIEAEIRQKATEEYR
jgi:hypothetical protein